MTLEEKVAQLFIIRPEDIAGEDALVEASDETLEALAHNTPGGICYFDQNIVTPDQTRSLLEQTQRAAQEASGLPLLQSVDEEGGVVSRIANNPDMNVRNVGPAGVIGARNDPEAAYDAAAAISDYLIDLGFNMDYAPDADIADGSDNTIQQRAFGSTAEAAAPLVAAQVRAFNEAGILCSAKHFPGIGGTFGDSHDALIQTDDSLSEMEASEFVPFRAAIEQNVPMVMVGHIACPQLTGDETPASLSPKAIAILRDDLGYQGVIVTDSLEMGAITEAYDDADTAVLALRAGADLLLLPNNYAQAYQGVLDAVQAGDLQESDIDAHATRVIAMKLQWADAAGRRSAETASLDLELDPNVVVLPESEWGSFIRGDERTLAWAQSFSGNSAVRLKVAYANGGESHPTYYRDRAAIVTAFNAIVRLNVQEPAEDVDAGESWTWVFSMADGSEKRFSFISGAAQVDGGYQTIDGNDVFEAFEKTAQEKAA